RENAAIAFDGRRDRQAHACVARRRFDDQPARLELSRALRRLNHRQADAILHRSAGIEELGLRVYGRADAARDLIDSDQGCPADRLEDVLVRLNVLRHSYPVAPWWCRAGVGEAGAAGAWCEWGREPSESPLASS